ncbi:MAG TPA: hypothetical protein ENN03_10670 [bacterium]|nr:hypothetical protein [bacterium]
MFPNRISWTAVKRCCLLWTVLFGLSGIRPLAAQNMTVLKSTGMVAVIGAGSNHGIRVGDMYAVKRYINGVWREVTYVQVTTVRPAISRIEVIEIAPQINLVNGDRLESMDGTESITPTTPPRVKTEPQKTITGTKPLPVLYVGPIAGALVPLKGMETGGGQDMETGILYGGVFGYRFRPGMDVTTRFLYAGKQNAWTMWNLHMVGRRYFDGGFIVEAGYDIIYPQTASNLKLTLGFVTGVGFLFGAPPYFSVELGLTYHIFPNYSNESTAQFMTIQARLIL